MQHYTQDQLEEFFGVRGTKVIGFEKSGLAKSLYAELKEYRINSPMAGSPRTQSFFSNG